MLASLVAVCKTPDVPCNDSGMYGGGVVETMSSGCGEMSLFVASLVLSISLCVRLMSTQKSNIWLNSTAKHQHISLNYILTTHFSYRERNFSSFSSFV